jgi:hypothetical protein
MFIVAKFRFGDQLPLNIFQVLGIISIIIFFLKRLSWTKFAYLIIVPVSVYGIIIVPSFYCEGSGFSLALIAYMFACASMIASSILNMIWVEEDLTKKDILDASLTYIIAVAFVHIINVLFRFTGLGIHANYFGTLGDGYDVLIGWLSDLINIPMLNLLPLLAILIGVEFLLVMPFHMVRSNQETQEHLEELIALGNLKAQAEFREKNKKSKSHILLKGEGKASPAIEKNIVNRSKSGFISTTKEIKVNKETEDK